MSPKNSARLNALRTAPLDKWIALSADESQVIASADSYAEAVRLSEEAGENDPLILKTPPQWAPLSV